MTFAHRTAALAAVSIFVLPAALAGENTADDTVEQPVNIEANIVCSITITTAPDPSSTTGTPLDTSGFIDGGTGGTDVIKLSGIDPANMSGTPLTYGGDMYQRTGDGALVAVAEIDVTVVHNCGTGINVGVQQSAGPTGANVPGATLHGTLGDVHRGTDWATTNFSELTPGVLISRSGQTTGSTTHADLAIVYDSTHQDPGTTTASVNYKGFVSP